MILWVLRRNIGLWVQFPWISYFLHWLQLMVEKHLTTLLRFISFDSILKKFNPILPWSRWLTSKLAHWSPCLMVIPLCWGSFFPLTLHTSHASIPNTTPFHMGQAHNPLALQGSSLCVSLETSPTHEP